MRFALGVALVTPVAAALCPSLDLNRNSGETAEVGQHIREVVGEHSCRRVLIQVVQERHQHDRFSQSPTRRLSRVPIAPTASARAGANPVRESDAMTTFGFQIPNFTFGGDDRDIFGHVVELAKTAEHNGFESIWVMDHFYQLPALGGGTQPMLEAYTLLGALAAVTSRARLGTLVTGVTYRNPAMLAKQVTTLDVISGGRAILGIGAAWHDTEHEAMGFDFPPVKERMDRLEEAVQICRAMFTQETPTFDGTLLPRARGAQRAASDPTGRPADHDRWERREAHVEARRAVRRPVQHHRRRRDDPAQARCAARALRERRTRSVGDHRDAPRDVAAHQLGGRRRRRRATSSRRPRAPRPRPASTSARSTRSSTRSARSSTPASTR